MLLACTAAHAELPVEQLTLEKLAPVDGYRLYVGDPTMNHLVDGRSHVVDGRNLHYLGMLGTGFAGQSTVSRDGHTIFVATTYYSRLQRGTRADVVEVYSADDLSFQYEIEIPTKRVQSLDMRALLATTGDDRLLLVQNATPATSVTVIDLAARKVAAEVPTPGCYGVIPWPAEARRFSSVCGDGTLATFDLDAAGAVASRAVSDKFFDPDQDPVFMHYEVVGKRLTFVSFHGAVHALDLGGAKPVPLPTWPLVDAADRKQGWRPGGYQLFAIEPRSERLYVGMHDHGSEGSHKSPAKEIWVFDLKTHKRIGRMPGQTAVSMNIARTESPRLFLLSGADNRLLAYDIGANAAPSKPLLRSEPVGETPIYLGMP
ncbi:MAG: amine dehydrogenase [Burkholderiales bacterium]|nr:amine dehydrogenase [Burkholderiales bacterium]